MAVKSILHYPDPRLRRTALPVERVDDAVRRLIDDMAETMYGAPGVGLAAIQVNEPKRVTAIVLPLRSSGLEIDEWAMIFMS